MHGNIQGQVGWGSEQPDLIQDVPAHCRGVGLDDLWRTLPAQSILWLYDSMIVPSDTKSLHINRGPGQKLW